MDLLEVCRQWEVSPEETRMRSLVVHVSGPRKRPQPGCVRPREPDRGRLKLLDGQPGVRTRDGATNTHSRSRAAAPGGNGKVVGVRNQSDRK